MVVAILLFVCMYSMHFFFTLSMLSSITLFKTRAHTHAPSSMPCNLFPLNTRILAYLLLYSLASKQMLAELAAGSIANCDTNVRRAWVKRYWQRWQLQQWRSLIVMTTVMVVVRKQKWCKCGGINGRSKSSQTKPKLIHLHMYVIWDLHYLFSALNYSLLLFQRDQSANFS